MQLLQCFEMQFIALNILQNASEWFVSKYKYKYKYEYKYKYKYKHKYKKYKQKKHKYEYKSNITPLLHPPHL